MKKNVYICVTVQQKLTEDYKSTILQQSKKILQGGSLGAEVQR